MIVRIQKRKSPYVQIDKTVLEDDRISWKAKGLLAYLLSRPDDWTVMVDQLASVGTDGKKAVQSALQELRSFRYAELTQLRSPDGHRAIGKGWIIHEQPLTTPFSDSQKSRQSENLTVRKRTPTKKEEENKKEEETKNPLKPPPTLPAEAGGIKEGRKPSLLPSTDQSKRVAAIFHRRLTTPWHPKEIAAYKMIGLVEVEDLSLVEEYYAKHWPPGSQGNILRHNLKTFLNNFHGELDRARAFKESGELTQINKNGPNNRTEADRDYDRTGIHSNAGETLKRL